MCGQKQIINKPVLTVAMTFAKHTCIFVAALSLPLLSISAARGVDSSYAPIMPLAARSLLLDIAAVGERLVAVGERGHVLYSLDNGLNWRQARVPTTQMLTGVYFIDERHGWTVGHDGLVLASDDSGETWRIQRDGLAVQNQINLELREQAHHAKKLLKQRLAVAADPERAQIEAELAEAQLDLEDADLALEEPVFTSPLLDVWFSDPDRGWAVGAFGSLVATRDGGQHWLSRQAELDNPEEFHLNAITGDGNGRIFIAGEAGVMFRSLDNGRSWQSMSPFYEGSWFGTVYSQPTDTLFVFGLRGNLFRSSDFGSSWEPVDTDNRITLAGGTASDEGHIVLAGGVGVILTSSDGGQSFQRELIEDSLSLSSGLQRNGQLILVGQGGVKVIGSTTDGS